MTAETPPAEEAGQSTAIAPRPVYGDVITIYESALEEVPDAGDRGVEAILEQIATAQTAAETADPWNAGGLGKYADMPLVITGIRKMPSDYEGGLSYFLVIDGAVRATGEKIAATTGSIGCVAQLLRVWMLDAFPVLVVPRFAKRPTKEGYKPMHLEFPEAKG